MALMAWKCVHDITPAYLSELCIPATTISGHQHLQQLALYWFYTPRLQLDNEVSQSADQPHGTVCHQHYGHRTCRRAPSTGHRRHTCSWPPSAIHDSGAGYKYPDLLTYLLTHFMPINAKYCIKMFIIKWHFHCSLTAITSTTVKYDVTTTTAPAHTTKSVTTGIIPKNGVCR